MAFDLLGSVNFGMSESGSDIDLVIYHDCPLDMECDMKTCNRYKEAQRWISEFIITHSYPVHIMDCLNLRAVLYAVHNGQYDNDVLIRYLFYRKVGRPINRKLLMEIDAIIYENKNVIHHLEDSLEELLEDFSDVPSQEYSFKKYLVRLRAMDIILPHSVQEKIFKYLGKEGARN